MKKYSFFILFISISLTAYNQNLSISGTIQNAQGDALCDATVTLSDDEGNPISTFTTLEDGNYDFSSLETGGNYQLTVSRDINLLNGPSTFDIVLMSRHILDIETINDPLSLYSLDLDNSAYVSIMDMVLLRRIILGIDNSLPVESWQFFSSDVQLDDPNNPWATSNIQTRIYENLSTSISDADFLGYKTGDANKSAAIDCN